MSQINAGKFIASTGVEFPSYTDNNKPTNLGTGATIYNSDTEKLETWNGSEWMVIGGGSEPDGTSQEKAATSAAAILQVNPSAPDGVYWINLPTVGPKQIYCALSSNHLGGGGWMLAWKCTRGSTFGYNSNYWTSANVYNETSGLNLNDGDHKNHAFNHYVANSIAAVFPDLNNGGQSSVPYSAWTWLQSGIGQTALTRLQSNQQLSSNPRGESSMSGSGFSNQNGYQWYGFNYTGNNSNRVRWGFGWNNEGDQNSNDVTGGIAPVRSGNSAGDHIYCCQGTTGVNRSIRAEIWVQ